MKIPEPRPVSKLAIGISLLALMATTGAQAQANASALIQSFPSSFCPGSVATTPQLPGSFTMPVFQRTELTAAGCLMAGFSAADRASLYGQSSAGNTVQGPFLQTFFGNVGGGASWQEQITPLWPSSVSLPGLARLRLLVQYEAGGGVGATGTGFTDANGNFVRTGDGRGFAGYSLEFGQGSGSPRLLRQGERNDFASTGPTQSGTWGLQTAFVDLVPSSGSSNDYSWGQNALFLKMGINHFSGMSFNGGFGSGESRVGLVWLGVIGAEALDAQGQVLALPTGFALGLRGGNSGFDYWNAAAPVPEPGTWALMVAGMLAIGTIARRRLAEREGS